jgi:hypothetical protein
MAERRLNRSGARDAVPVLPSLLAILETSLTVADVAERRLKYVRAHWTVGRAARWLEERGFDVAPVLEKPAHRYVELAELSDARGTVDSLAKPIDAARLATANLGLAEGIMLLREARFFFVISGNTLDGIVTHSDLQRPAVGMVTLSLILAAEAGMNPIIELHHGPDWPRVLSPGRRERAQNVLEQRRRHNVEIGLLDCLMLEDRLTLLRKLTAVLNTLGFQSTRAFGEWTKRLEELRNALAHGGDILDVEPDPAAAINMFSRVRSFAEGTWALSTGGTTISRQGR